VINLTRHVLPIMRRQRSGHIIQIYSLGGCTAFSGNTAYFASKWKDVSKSIDFQSPNVIPDLP
jgi:NADP-dependent 3-hydroxy acid dehydrogenase YdfG